MKVFTKVIGLLVFASRLAALAVMFCLLPGTTQAQELASNARTSESPWLLVPTLSNNPKIGLSFGGLAGYLHQFDPDSSESLFGVSTTYSSTDSYYALAFAQMFFDGGRQKLFLSSSVGKINNDYKDFLGSGLPAQTTDNVAGFAGRYTREIAPNWFVGGQFLSGNYVIEAEGVLGQNLASIGLTGFDSVGVGLLGEYDSRDNQRNATTGQHGVVHNIAFRESLGGKESFDVYYGKFADYRKVKERYVIATQLHGRWTDDVPKGAQSSVALRGYVRGMQLAPNYMHLAMDNRFSIKGKWGLTIYGGIACLYDSLSNCSNSDSVYPAVGGGVSYLLREEAGIVIRLEFIVGKDDNQGIYLTMGNPF